MSALANLVAAYDEAALVAVLSKGAVIRARREVAAGKVPIQQLDGNTASVDVDGVTLTLDGKELAAARCACPAVGLCRHIAAAVLHLREAAPAAPTELLPPAAILTLEGVEKFAGKDWSHALAMTDAPVSIAAESSTLVSFVETNEVVTFPAGLALNKALYKGPNAARKKRAIAAAALILLRNKGQALPERVIDEAKAVSVEVLEAAVQALAQAAQALSSGTVALARDRLFSLAISTRAEAVPRLSAELRALSQRLDPERLRRAEEKPVDLFYAMARTFALTEALRITPSDPALIGVLARHFSPSGRRRLAFLGAEHWRTASGARGLTNVFLNLETGRTQRAVEARGAGVDLRFRPQDAWGLPLWSLASPARMAGKEILLEDAACAPDGNFGLTQQAVFGPGAVSLDRLEITGAVVGDWDQLPERIDEDLGRGLRQRVGEMFTILKPHTVEVPSFDPLQQRLVWTWQDAQEQEIVLNLPPDTASGMDAITSVLGRVVAGLVALSPQSNGGSGRVIALYLSGQDGGWRSLQFERLPELSGLRGVMERFKARAVPRSVSTLGAMHPLSLFFERMAEAVLASLSGARISNRLREDARALGQTHVLSMLEQMDAASTTAPKPATALRLAYLLSEGARLSDRSMCAES
ncbi:hypothetical protein [uncultured Microbulbifer sp.]|uniref:hypothetical protein n=1 Tax=uncultured Microbulbifer sp. TaxID=348147 RepID=UPI00260D5EC0|nr:hypothetical protein [uncultured Microbulbifer sp.]